MEILNVYKIGLKYRYVLIKERKEKRLHNNSKNTNENEKLYNNLCRAKTTISNLVLCNNFKYFFTQTINGNYNREDLDYFRKSVNNKIRKLRKKYNLKLQFILIPERHKNRRLAFTRSFK